MSALGSLVVKLSLDYASYSQGLGKADQDALGFAKRTQENFDNAAKSVGNFLGKLVGGAVAAVASYETVAAIVTKVADAINRLDEISKSAQKFGIPAEELQKLAYAGQLADVSLETLGQGAKKLSTNLVEAAAGGKEQKAVFESLGVAVKNADGSLRESAEVLADLADEFQRLPDGPLKSALAVQLFGKAGLEMIPLLNGGKAALSEASEEAQKFGLVIGGETLKAAERFNDNLTRLGNVTKGTFNAIAQGVLPVLGDLSEAYIKATTGAGSLNEAAQRLAKDGSIQSWAESVVLGLTSVIDAGHEIYRVFSFVLTFLDEVFKVAETAALRYGEAINKALKGDVSGALEAFNSVGTQVKSAIDNISNSFKAFNAPTLGQALRDQIKGMQDARAATAEFSNETGKLARQQAAGSAQAEKMARVQAALGNQTQKAGKQTDEAGDAFLAFNDALDKHEEELLRVIKGQEKATEAEKLLAEINNQSSDRARKLTAEYRQLLIVRLEGIKVEEQQAKIAQVNKEFEKKRNDELAKSLQTYDASTTKLKEQLVELQNEYNLLGASETQIVAVEAARIRNVAAMKMEKAAILEGFDASSQEAARLREEADLLNKIADQKEKNAAAKANKKVLDDQKDAAKALTDDIGHWLMEAMVGNGRSAWDTLRDYVKTKALEPLIKPVAEGLSNWFSSIFGGAGGSGGGLVSGLVGGGGGGGLMSTLQSIKTLYDTVTTGFANVGTQAAGLYSAVFGGTNLAGGAAGTVGGVPAGALLGDGSGVIATTSNAGAFGTVASGAAGAVAGIYGGRAISGGYSAFGGSGNGTVNAGTAIGAVVGSIVPVIGTAVGAAVGGLIGGLVNRAFGRRAPEVEGRAIEGSFSGSGSFSGENVQRVVERGGWFRSDKRYDVRDAIMGDLDKALDEGGKQIADLAQKYGEALGLPVAQLAEVSTAIKVEVTDNLEDNTKQVEAALQAYADALLGTFADDIEPLRKAGETVSQTIERVGTTLLGVNQSLSLIGKTALEASVGGAEAAVALTDLFGGLGGLQQATSSFYQGFFSDQERTARAMESLGTVFTGLGETVPKTRDEFKNLVLAQDLTTASGRETYATLLSVSGAFADLVPAARSAADIANERADLERQLLEVQGNIVEIRRLEREALDESNRALYDQITALEDQKDAAELAAEAIEKAAQSAAGLNQAIDSNIGKFLSPEDNIRYQAERVSANLATVGGTLTADDLLGLSKQEIFDLTKAFIELSSVSDDVKTVVVEAAGAMADLVDEAARLANESALKDVEDQLSALTAEFGDLTPFIDNTETVTDAWRRTSDELTNLQEGFDNLMGNVSRTVQEVLADLIRQRTSIQSFRSGLQDQLFDTRLNTLSPQGRVDALRSQQASLFNELQTTDDVTGVARKLSANITRLAQEEAKVREAALKKEIGLAEEAGRASQDAIRAQIDGLEKLKSMGQDLRQFTAELRFSDLSPKSFDDQLATARALFEDTVSKARSGDAFAAGNLQSNARAFLDEAAAYSPVGTKMYADIFNEVTAALDELASTNVDPQLEALQALLSTTTSSSEQELAVSEAQLEQLQQLDSVLASREAELSERIEAQAKLAQDQIDETKRVKERLEARISQAADQFIELRALQTDLTTTMRNFVTFYTSEQGG